MDRESVVRDARGASARLETFMLAATVVGELPKTPVPAQTLGSITRPGIVFGLGFARL